MEYELNLNKGNEYQEKLKDLIKSLNKAGLQ